MITLNTTERSNRLVLHLVGLSTDEKPTTEIEGLYITNGSTLYCMDSKVYYMLDEEFKVWYEV